jgi:hypothetical protein
MACLGMALERGQLDIVKYIVECHGKEILTKSSVSVETLNTKPIPVLCILFTLFIPMPHMGVQYI